MDYYFDDWKKALEEFKRGVTRELEEIRQQKEEIRQLKAEIFSAKNAGYYLRDAQRIVISAPEIILGNVDRDGILLGGGSHVVVRGNKVDLEGVGEVGNVNVRAASIRQTAVNPGIDGQEAVVEGLSEVVSQAGSIVLEANSSHGVFSQIPSPAGSGGVRIHADRKLEVEASLSSALRMKSLDSMVKALEDQKKQAEKEADAHLKSFEDTAKTIKAICDYTEGALEDVMTVRTNIADFDDVEQQMTTYSAALYKSYDSCAAALSRLAEINRRITCLKKEKEKLPSGNDYKQKFTGASVSIVGERINMASRDGDGNVRDNEGAGLGILANAIKVEAVDAAGALQKEGKLFVNARTVEVSTQTTQDLKYNDKGELEGGNYIAEGDVLVRSKNVTFESIDQEIKDKKLQEKALTQDGSFTVRTQKTDFCATDTEGKATGSIALNAKEVSVRSMNVDKEKRTDDKLAEGSSMLLLSEKMFVGARKKDVKSKKVQVVSEEVGIFADKTLELQQDEAKAALQLSGGNAAVGGSKVEVFGATTITGKAEVKDELKAPKATIDNLEAKTSFKSSNISDGIAIPGAPANGKLSAKLKAEDAPEKK